MILIKNGDTVRLHYKGTLNDGTLFDSSEGRSPLEFTAGEGQVIPGFDAAVLGMTAGQSKTFNIPADQAYGDKRDDMIITINRDDIPEDITLEIGLQLAMSDGGGNQIPVQIIDITEDAVTLDGNHPLAGQDLNFEITIVEVVG